jgi:two-component system NtrC family sensor kinase
VIAQQTPQEKRPTVLIVDDEAANLTVLSGILESYYRVRATRTGEKALQIAAAEPHPDLLLLDIMMPGMNGLQVIERLRGDPVTRDIPVIFVTALNTEDIELQGFDMGAADYITKPIKAALLLARVRTQLALKQARDQLHRQNLDLEAEVRRRQQENEKIQLQLLQADKMAAVGQLAAGVAHEINTPIGYAYSNLNSLAGYIEDLTRILDAYRGLVAEAPDEFPAAAGVRRLERELDPDSLLQDAGQLLVESRHGLERVKTIVRDLKDFSRQSEAQWEWVDLHAGLEATLNIVWNQLKYCCELHKEYGTLPPVLCLPSQLNQVFLNLLVNAAQAIEERGHIHLRTGAGDGLVWVEVEDTGIGMTADDMKHIFEPFFTTKPRGEGTGLGLPLSYGIIERHGGHIEVESQPGQGSRFRVVLPVRPPGVAEEL